MSSNHGLNLDALANAAKVECPDVPPSLVEKIQFLALCPTVFSHFEISRKCNHLYSEHKQMLLFVSTPRDFTIRE